MGTDLTNRTLLRQSPQIVNAKYSLTKSESDLVYALLTTIDKDDIDFKDYSFTIAELESKLRIQITPTQLKETAKSLMSKVLEVKHSEKDWELFTWFSYFRYKNGVITCSFDKRLKPYLLELKQFILTDFNAITRMKSDYSRRIYLLLKEQEKFGSRTFKIEELQEILKVPKSYLAYKNFNTFVLQQAEKEINAFTDLQIKNIEVVRKIGKKIVEIKINTQKNQAQFKDFIDWIRVLHINEDLYYWEDKIVRCSEKGHLYFKEDLKTLDKESALRCWEFLHTKKDFLMFQVEEKLF